jgi:hypothetical protein
MRTAQPDLEEVSVFMSLEILELYRLWKLGLVHDAA